MEAVCSLRLIKRHVGLRELRIHLTQRRQVIEHPEGATMRRDHEIIIFHDQVVDRRSRQIQLQRLPMRAVVKGNIDARGNRLSKISTGEAETSRADSSPDS